MARRYTRREFLTDASFAFSSSVLLKALAPGAVEQEAIATTHPSESVVVSGYQTPLQFDKG